MSDQTPKENTEDHPYTTHNFEAMNRAIDTEVDRRLEISEIYRYEGSSRRSLMAMHIATSLSVVAVAAAVIWWLFNQPTISAPSLDVTPSYTNVFDRNTREALNVISAEEKSTTAGKSFIDTSFTVFHRTIIPTGEYVVTGKTYQPDNLKYPSEQYCYLEKTESSTGLAGEPLASINQGDFTLETKDEELISYARKYCQFSK